jgi:hypothetical protein
MSNEDYDFEEEACLEQKEEDEATVEEYLETLSDDERESLMEYEFYKEWILREPELEDMGIEEFEDNMQVEMNGLTDEELGIDDED